MQSRKAYRSIVMWMVALVAVPCFAQQQGMWTTDVPVQQAPPAAQQAPQRQQQGPAWSNPQAADVSNPLRSPEAMLADHLITMSRSVLNSQGDIRKDQLVRCRVLIELALSINPGDADAWALRRELARLSGDFGTEFEALREYCRLRPSDDAAQLDLILTSAEGQQTAEKRIETVEQVLQTNGGMGLTAPVRSRLASYLAEQSGEVGDEQAFASWLKESVALDPNNPHAAQLTYQLAVAKAADPLTMGAALLRVLRTNPLDARSRRVFADLLMTQGAFEVAADQYLVTRAIGLPEADSSFVANWAVCLAGAGKPYEAITMIDGLEQGLKQVDANSGLPINLELLRLTLQQQTGQLEESKAAFLRVRQHYHERLQRGDDTAAIMLSWLTALYADQLSPQFEQAIAGYLKRNPKDKTALRTLAWIYLRNAKYDEAAGLLHSLAETDVFSVYGLAKAAAGQGSELREGYLNRTIQMSPASLAGLMAASDLRDMGQSPQITRAGAALTYVLSELPPTISAPTPGVTPWTQLRLTMPDTEYSYLEPVQAELELTNNTSFTMELGPRGALPTNVVIYVTAWQGGEVVSGVEPLVVEMRRKVTLAGGDTLRVPVRLDRGTLGQLFAYNPTLPIGFTAAAVLDPRPDEEGSIGTGPLGSVAMVKPVYRAGVRPTSMTVRRWLSDVDTAIGNDRLELLALLGQMTSFLVSEPSRQGDVVAIARKLNTMFPQLSPVEKAWLIFFTNPNQQVAQLMPNLHNAGQSSEDALIRVSYLAAHVADPNSPAMTSALRSTTPEVTAYAQALRSAITGQ